MSGWWNKFNRKLTGWLWWVVLAGIIASLPVAYARHQTESSADQTAIVIDYRDLLQIGAGKPDSEAFVAHELRRLMDAGVNGAIVYESTLEELSWSGEVAVYTGKEAAALEGRIPSAMDNRTYVHFLKPEHEPALRPIIEEAFAAHGADVTDWSFEGERGVIIDMGRDDAMLRPMQPNPIEMQKLKDAGLWIVPRLSDRFTEFDENRINAWVKKFKEFGVDRVTFDGNAVPGFSFHPPEPDQLDGIERFGYILKNNGIGIASFENLRTPVQGLGKLAGILDYNVIRAHSVTDGEMAVIKAKDLEDRIVLAVKDRNIRLVFLNSVPVRDAVKGRVTHPLDTIVHALQGVPEENGEGMLTDGVADSQTASQTASGGAVADLQKFGFSIGVPQAFDVKHAPAEKLLRAVAVLGSIALVAITIGMFLPSLTGLSFAAGIVGGAGLYVLSPHLMLQALALFTAIAAPTAAVVLLVRRLRDQRSPDLSAGKRLASAVLLYIRTAMLSLAAVPLVVALLNHIAYSLVLQQFRGVSLLHAAPIALAAIYVFLYGSGTVYGNLRRILMQPVTVFWIAVFGVLAVAGLYYMSRTGNAGTVSGIELAFRSMLENTFGVRPRTKEFLIGHPMMLAGIFLALKYRQAGFLLVLATIGQLSMVDTFAHIHTPLVLSIARVLLGLGLGLVIGLIAIGIWQACERVWRRLEVSVVQEAK